MARRLLSAAVGAATMSSVATGAGAAELTLDRLFGSPALSGPAPRVLKLSPDGRLATLLRNRADDRDRYDLWAIDTATGAARMLVDSRLVGSGTELSEAEKMNRERARLSGIRGIVAYDWAPDGRSLLVPLDGDLYLADLDGKVRRLTDTPETETDARVSARGNYVSFVRAGNLFVQPLPSGSARQVTPDGGGTTSWGVAEFIAQEEMHRFQGHWWAPDDSRIAVARVDESGVAVVPRAAIDADGTRVYQQRYPLAGTANALVDLYLMKPDGSERVRVDLGEDSDIYLARVDWLPDAAGLLVQRQSRDQKRLDVLRVDAVTGRAELLFSETAKSWVNLHDNLRALKDGSLIWSSERDGYMHLYRWQAGQWTQLTHGSWSVLGVTGVDQDAGRVFFTANRDDDLESQLYVLDYRTSGTPRRLTEGTGWNAVVMDRTGRRMLVTHQDPGQPPQVYLADADGRRIGWVEENRLDAGHPYAPYLAGHVLPRFGTIKAADGQTLHYKLLMPADAGAGQRHPVLVRVYGGPGAGRQVTATWDGGINQYLVDRGWIVFSIDNRGTPDRGKAFEDPIYHAMGGVEVQDQLAGLQWLKAQSFVDPDRVAVMGWSYGGYMTLRLLAGAPGAYAAGIAVAPVTGWEKYDTHYTERYLGNPARDKAPYDAAGVLPIAQNIADPLLLIHGMADDNVTFDNSSALIGRLQDMKKPFEMMAYPGKTHAIAGSGTSVHLWSTIEAFLDRTVRTPSKR